MRIIRGLGLFLATLFLLGTALLLFLSILTGGTETSILRRFYWLETDCSRFPGAPVDTRCRWTNYGICSVSDGKNTDCTHASAAFPFSPSRNFHSNENLPSAFVDHANYYYYTSRIGYGFALVGLAFLVFSWIPFIALIVAKGASAASTGIFWALYALAIIFIIIAVALWTACYARGRSKFRDAGFSADLGTKAMATSWATVFLILFNIPFIAGAFAKWGGFKNRKYKNTNNYDAYDLENENNQVGVGAGTGTGAVAGVGGVRAANRPGFVSWFQRTPKQSGHAYSGTTNTGSAIDNGGAGGTTTGGGANYLSFTPMKERGEVKAGATAVDRTAADGNLYP